MKIIFIGYYTLFSFVLAALVTLEHWTFNVKMFRCYTCYKWRVIFKGTCNTFSLVHRVKCMH